MRTSSEQYKFCMWNPPSLTTASLPLGDIYVYLFSVINHNHEIMASSEFHESFKQIIKCKGGFGKLSNLQLV